MAFHEREGEMEFETEQTLPDAELERRARELFEQVRAEQPEARAARALVTAGAAAGEVIPGLPDWLVEAGESDADHNGE